MRAEKQYLVAEVETHLKKSDYVILTNFTGVTVADVNPLGLLLSVVIALGSVGLLLLVIALAWYQERKTIRLQLVDEVGYTLSAAEFSDLTGRWRRPSRWRPSPARPRPRRHAPTRPSPRYAYGQSAS